MTDHDPPRDAPSVVGVDTLAEGGEQTAGLQRLQAFAGEGRWIGIVRSMPGEWSAWHHHGENDSYFYVLGGRLEFEFGSDVEPLSVGTGEFGHLPGTLIHRERTAPGAPGEVILVRIGTGPTVVDADDPG